MMDGHVIRAERPADIPDIDRTIRSAFATLSVGVRTEHLIVEGLRAAGALTLSLVAERDRAIVGHVAISPVTISDGAAGWYGLGPVAVAPEHQRAGLGQSLIRTALACMRDDGAHGCVVYGHPAYYPRFGFIHDPGLILPGAASTHFFALRWRDAAAGTVAYHPAFSIAP